jgi:pimeloyl-ACP methyl ester carboxylesterase
MAPAVQRRQPAEPVRRQLHRRRLRLLRRQAAAEIDRLVLLNPQLNYKKRTIDSRVCWHDDQLGEAEASQLSELGYIQFTPTLMHGRAILNEVFWLEPLAVLGEITAPTLLVHGTKDTFVPAQDSQAAAPLITAEHRLMEIEGSQHGFAVHDDPQYLNPQSQAWQALVIETVAEWITASS